MVLWEITVATAYFLGLKRTYRLALKIQRRIVGPNHPKIRQFLHRFEQCHWHNQGLMEVLLSRRTRAAFNVALQVHQNIQQRDIEVGRNLGNWILRWLDCMKPSAQIRVSPSNDANSKTNLTKQVSNFSHKNNHGTIQKPRNGESDRHLFTSSRSIWRKSFPAIAMMRPPRTAGSITQYRQLGRWGPGMLRPQYKIARVNGLEGVIRKDIIQYLMQN